MPDYRTIDELSLEELEALLEQRQRIERARQFAENPEGRHLRPVTGLPSGNTRTGTRTARKPRRWRDRALWFIELAAGVALAAIIAGSLTNLDTLNREVLQSRTATPVAVTDPATQELPAAPFPPAQT